MNENNPMLKFIEILELIGRFHITLLQVKDQNSSLFWEYTPDRESVLKSGG